MIIRRRHTKNFVTLENTLVRDRRLSLDEHGMLHYLLSLPDDWEVSRTNCAKFWNIGREKAARIFRSLRKCGWAQVERMHGDDGTFLGVRWIITDEPGEEVPEAVLDQEPDGDDDAPAAASDAVENPAAADHDAAQPEHGSTVVRPNRDTANPYHGPYIDSKKTDSEENRIPQNGAGDLRGEGRQAEPSSFTDLAKLWPIDHILSRVAAEQAWQRLSKVNRQKSFDVASRYLADCRSNSRKVCDLTTYLREERFERFAASPAAGASFVAKPYSPQWHRWLGYLKAMGKPVAFMELQASKGVGWATSMEWPPPLPPELAGAVATATGPPDVNALMNEQDAADFK